MCMSLTMKVHVTDHVRATGLHRVSRYFASAGSSIQKGIQKGLHMKCP